MAEWSSRAKPGELPPAAVAFEALTTGQVVQRVIKPLTNSTQGSYVQLLLAQDARDEAGRPLVANATVFVSHAWLNPFIDLTETLLFKLDGKALGCRLPLE
jgi:hypothetical protein